MMMPPNSLYTMNKGLGYSRYYLHRWVIGYDDVDMSKFPGKSSQDDELSEGKKWYILASLPDTYIESLLQIWETNITFFKGVECYRVSLFLESLSTLECHLYSASHPYALWMKYGNVRHRKTDFLIKVP